jgi:hypothetical protein
MPTVAIQRAGSTNGTIFSVGRPKDIEFCRALVRAKLIDADVVRSRAPTIDSGVDVDELTTTRVERLLNSADSIYLHLRGAAASTGSVSQ